MNFPGAGLEPKGCAPTKGKTRERFISFYHPWDSVSHIFRVSETLTYGCQGFLWVFVEAIRADYYRFT
jgi:hypothetical protein